MPRGGQNRMPVQAKRRYFELIREGRKGAAASGVVGVSTSCGSKWFIEAGGVLLADRPISPRWLTQDDRIAIADALYAGHNVKTIATLISKSFQTVYREIKRNSKPDGSYHPWWAHNQALQRRQRPKPGKLASHGQLREVIAAKLQRRWSPQQISRFLARSHPDQPAIKPAPKRSIEPCMTARWAPRPASCAPVAPSVKPSDAVSPHQTRSKT